MLRRSIIKMTPTASHEFYEALKELMPGLPCSVGVKSLRIILEAGSPAMVELETYVDNKQGVVVKAKYELKARQ